MQKKYEFTGETKDWFGTTLKRIRAARDFTLNNGTKVVKGDLGGWIEKETNLSHEGSAWVSDNAKVYCNAMVCDNASVSGDARVYGNARIYGDAKVCGNAVVYGDADVCDDARVYGNAQVYDDARVYGDAEVYGNAWVERKSDVIWFKNIWSSGRTFTYTRSNGKWTVGCFYGTGEELIKKAYADSEVSGKCYEAIVEAVEKIYKSIEQSGKQKK